MNYPLLQQLIIGFKRFFKRKTPDSELVIGSLGDKHVSPRTLKGSLRQQRAFTVFRSSKANLGRRASVQHRAEFSGLFAF
jgi:hypothetical protein